MNDGNLIPEENTPLAFTKNPPLTLVAQYGGGRGGRVVCKRRYTPVQAINELAVRKFRPNGKGVTYRDLMEAGLAKHKKTSPRYSEILSSKWYSLYVKGLQTSGILS